MNHARLRNAAHDGTSPAHFVSPDHADLAHRANPAMPPVSPGAGEAHATVHRTPPSAGLTHRYITVTHTPYQCCEGNMEGYFAGGVLPEGEIVWAGKDLDRASWKHREPVIGYVRGVGLVHLDPHSLRHVEEL